jgi:cellulose synthase operon protein C
VPRLPRPAALPAICALAFACGHAARPPATPSSAAAEARRRLDEAERAASADPLAAARAGWLRYLVASDAPGAEARLRTAARDGKERARALALCGQAEILEDRLESEPAVRAWIDALRAAPADPLAELAASRLLDVQGDSRAVDDAIVEAAERAPAGLVPRAARLLREAAARSIGARVAEAGPPAEAEAWRRMGVVRSWRVAGPFAALRLFDLSRALPLDGPSNAVAPADGSAGPTGSRALDFPDGDVGLDLEPSDGDVFYAASELRLSRGGDYLAWIEGAAALELRFDGSVALSRAPYPREMPRAQTVAVRLAPGTHQALVRWSRAEGARFRLTLVRADGAPADFVSAAPAELAGARREAPCPLGRSCSAPAAWSEPPSLQRMAEERLREDGGDPLAAWLLARAVMGEERAAARLAVDRAVALSASGAPALLLRAQEVLHDPEVPERLGRSRALVDLSQAARKDPLLLRARLTAAALQRDAERYDDAAQELQQAEAALRHLREPPAAPGSVTAAAAVAARPPPAAALPARLQLARARLLDAQGNAAAARAGVDAALRVDPGRCDARTLRYELARREGSLSDQLKAAEGLLPCGDGASTLAGLLRDRRDLSRAEELLALLAAAHPAQPPRLHALADVQGARKEVAAAARTLRRAAALAPRSADPLRRLAGVLEASGDARGADEARARAQALAPGDLALRRQLALSRGEHVLGWADRDGLSLASDAKVNVPPGASAVRLLDHGAVQIYPDGGAVERVHSVVRVLDKRGISRFGEAHLPGDAEVLQLRTIKRDGRTLEPESIPEKEGVTLPGLEPGDAIEIDYLRPIPPRGPELRGLALGGFFFRDEQTPMVESTYELRAPLGLSLEVDAHNTAAPPIETVAGEQRFRMTVRNVVPQEPEPRQPPEAETMPWIQLGAGAGQRELVRSIGDWVLLRGRPGSATDELARATGSATPRERAVRIHAAVAQAVRGRSQGSDFSLPAAHILAQGRGNRLLPLKAALASAGIGSHIVLVRGFNQDQAPYRFPRSEAYGWAVLRVDLPDAAAWVDPTYRLAPFDQLPAFLRGQDAWVVPEPGEEPQQIRTPVGSSDDDGREVALRLSLDAAAGAATGGGRDRHLGFEAASLKDALERLDDTQRKQAVESLLGRGLRGVELESLAAEGEAEVGGATTLVYELRVQLARREGEQLLVPASVLPQRLSRRWVQKAERALPLLVDSTEKQITRAEIALPDGFHLRAPPAPVALRSPYGEFSWRAREERGKLIIEESFALPQQRVPPARYAAFAELARRIDEVEGQDLVLSP